MVVGVLLRKEEDNETLLCVISILQVDLVEETRIK
jgi:hypothetical protein